MKYILEMCRFICSEIGFSIVKCYICLFFCPVYFVLFILYKQLIEIKSAKKKKKKSKKDHTLKQNLLPPNAVKI